MDDCGNKGYIIDTCWKKTRLVDNLNKKLGCTIVDKYCWIYPT